MSSSEQMACFSGRTIQMEDIVCCLYQDPDAFKLIIYKSKGTQYEEFLHELVKIEVEATQRFMVIVKDSGHSVKEVTPELEHMLLSSSFVLQANIKS